MKTPSTNTVAGLVGTALCLLMLVGGVAGFSDDEPRWWRAKGVVPAGATVTNDFAAINQGQLKWAATRAREYFDLHFTNGAGTSVVAMVEGFSTNDNFAAVNAGQFKTVVEPFYRALTNEGYSGEWPWSTNTTDDDVDFAAVNAGQLKHAFAFGGDADADGWLDWWEELNFGGLDNAGPGDVAGPWIERMGDDDVEISWALIADTNITAIEFSLVNLETGTPASNLPPFTARETTAIVIDDLTPDARYRFCLIPVGSGPLANRSRCVRWQQRRAIHSWRLSSAVDYAMPVNRNPGFIDTLAVVGDDFLIGWDRFYVSSRPDGASGWLARGLDLQVNGIEATGTNAIDVVDRGTALEVSERITGTGVHGLALTYNGSVERELDAPSYLLRWRPAIRFEVGAEAGP